MAYLVEQSVQPVRHHRLLFQMFQLFQPVQLVQLVQLVQHRRRFNKLVNIVQLFKPDIKNHKFVHGAIPI